METKSEVKSILIDIDLHKQIKIFCANNDLKIKDWIERVLGEELIKK